MGLTIRLVIELLLNCLMDESENVAIKSLSLHDFIALFAFDSSVDLCTVQCYYQRSLPSYL